MYSNSSFLSLFADGQTLGLIYMAGAAMTALCFILAPSIIRRFGNYNTAITLVCLQIALFYGLTVSSSSIVLIWLFILQTAVISFIGLTLDIFLEVYTDGDHIGATRGLYSATLNASWVIAPLLGSLLINGEDNYRHTYIAALAMLFPLLYLIHKNFPRFRDPNYNHISTGQLIRLISSNPNWKKLFIANIILQIFYAWMVVYSPIYLHTTIGFGWEEIGIILTIMLLPFPLIQYHLGKLADERYGEKEIMAIGFAIAGIATIALSLINLPSVLIWSLALFTTRIGAAAVEVMIETYFFKTVSPKDSAILGSFRLTRPISYFIAPLITVLGLIFTTNANLFIIVGIITLFGLYPALTIKDTR